MNDQITAEELERLSPDEYTVIDIRDPAAFEYGHITGALNIPQDRCSSQSFRLISR